MRVPNGVSNPTGLHLQVKPIRPMRIQTSEVKAFHQIEDDLSDDANAIVWKLGNVDIAWLPLLHRARLVEERSGYDFLSDHPKVKAWQDALMGTGIAQRSVPEDFDRAFSDFYLSDETYLGRGAKDDPEEASQGAAPCCGEGAGAGACC